MRTVFYLLLVSFLLSACSLSRQVHKAARQMVLQDSALQTAHIGISIYEPATGKWWYNWQGDKYFVPASNVKIPTCYAAMKYLGDSLVGLRYGVPEEKAWGERTVIIDPAGDPSFLHWDYQKHPVFDYLQANKGKRIGVLVKPNSIDRWGNGWSWNDYDAAYMVERNSFPAYGNVVRISLNDSANRVYIDTFLTPGKRLVGKLFKTQPVFFDSLVNQFSQRIGFANAASSKPKVELARAIATNSFFAKTSNTPFVTTEIPFVTNGTSTTLDMLAGFFSGTPCLVAPSGEKQKFSWECDDNDIGFFHVREWKKIHSQPTDSLLRPMMHRSDNFFAEQTLLMVSNEVLGYMNDDKIIDTLLKTVLADLPQKPRWADGSGLSRYNLFTPQDFVAILNKMKAEFGMSRIREIFPGGGEGTLSNFYKSGQQPYLHAKTGTLSGVVALSGFLTTQSGKELIVSVLVNNHRSGAVQVRRTIEKFLQALRNQH